jgi:hypothetical protein
MNFLLLNLQALVNLVGVFSSSGLQRSRRRKCAQEGFVVATRTHGTLGRFCPDWEVDCRVFFARCAHGDSGTAALVL